MKEPFAHGSAQVQLAALARLALEAEAQRLAAEAQRLAERVAEGRFFVACVGQFKRGKSSLINALVGAEILPVGVVPVTAVVTVVRYGEARSARVRLASGDWAEVLVDQLSSFVSEAENPENEKGITGVEVFLPHPLLATGLCLVDTPGIGSVLAGNTAATRDFVPQVDAALVVLGADPPISAEELDLVTLVTGQVGKALVFACNKADRLPEVDAREAAAFTRGVLTRRLGSDPGPVLLVSAAERRTGSAHPRDWPALEAALEGMAAGSGRALVASAARRGFSRLAGRLAADLAARREALVRPLQESEAHVAALACCVEDAVTATGDLEALFVMEQQRLAREFERQKEEFLARAVSAARRELSEALRAPERTEQPATRLHASAEVAAREISERWLNAWLAQARPLCEGLYVRATGRFTAIADTFLERLASGGDTALASLPRALEPETGFGVRSGLYYTSMMTLTGQGIFGWVAACFRDREATLSAVERKVGGYMERLLVTNASRIEHDFNDRVRESHRRVLRRVRDLLSDVQVSAEEALLRARRIREEGTQAVEEELSRIDGFTQELGRIGGDGSPARRPYLSRVATSS